MKSERKEYQVKTGGSHFVGTEAQKKAWEKKMKKKTSESDTVTEDKNDVS
jgi:hypothetical protein